MKKLYFVKIAYTAVVVAQDDHDAIVQADRHSDAITSDNVCTVEAATEIQSVDELLRLDPAYDVEDMPYGKDKPIKSYLE